MNTYGLVRVSTLGWKGDTLSEWSAQANKRFCLSINWVFYIMDKEQVIKIQ